MSKRAWSNESSRRRRIKPSSAELQRDKRITRVTRSASGRGFVITGKHRYVGCRFVVTRKNQYMDRSPAAGSWLPDNTGNWTDHRLRVRSYRTSPVSGQINGLSSALSPPDFGLPTGWAARRKNPYIVRENRNCWKKRISNFKKIKCIAFARKSIHFFLPHMNF